MFDIRWIRENAAAFDAGLALRGLEPMSAVVLKKDAARREHVATLQDAQNRRNAASKEIGAAKASGDEVRASQLIAEIAELKSFVQSGEEVERRLDQELTTVLSGIPNLPHRDVPVGKDESANVELHTSGKKPEMNFKPRQHFELGEALGLMDFETAARLSGARFVVLKGALARMERALGAFMLDIHTGENGYSEIAPPILVRDHAMFGTGQLPKFENDQFRTTDGFWLIPTAEVPLTNLARETIHPQENLPLRYTAYTPCFRLEAGSAGKDTRGIIRQHQFSKVELVSITTPEKSAAEHDRMLACAEKILQRLGLHYRVVTLATGDLGFGARKTYDIEVWLPGQGAYREISSCSVCGDFQARRMNARYRQSGSKKTEFVHTLNGSGLAVGRTLVAILENFQRDDGSIEIPVGLQPYMGGMTVIEKAANE